MAAATDSIPVEKVMEEPKEESQIIHSRQVFHSNSTGHDFVQKRRPSFRRANTKRFTILESTDQHHKSMDSKLYGPYAHIRAKLDYSYHSHYRKERQWLQDSIIEDILDLCTIDSHDEPWLVVSVGAPGAGKRYTLNKIGARCCGKSFVGEFVHVDSVEISRRFPEFESFCEQCPDKVDALTKKESGHIMEILVMAGLQSGKHVVLDCSLQDAGWYGKFFEAVKREFPHIKIALFLVSAPRNLILSRGRQVAIHTKRVISPSTIDHILQQIPKSVEQLKSRNYFDYDCEFDNSDDEINLVGGDWASFDSAFAQAAHVIELDTLPAPKLLSGIKAPAFSARMSSEENHKSDLAEFYGPYSHIRATLDYNYHSHYTRKRQNFQDKIITDMLNGAVLTDKFGNVCTTPTEPWIVFTAGAMGAGKSYTMGKLVESGRFPLLAFVSVDPDEIRRHLPEYHLYVDKSPELAGELTRKEAGFIAEILTLGGLQAGKNVLVDGSLRDSNWYTKYFARLKQEFPALRQAIIHVTAPRDAIFKRAADRALVTGRVVPRKTLEMAIEQVPRSVKILGPLVDYFCELNNAPNREIEIIASEETWESFESKWAQTCAWIPSRRKFLKPTRSNEAKLSLSGRKAN